MDSEDLAILGEMLTLGANYIAEQDEPADQANIPIMEHALETLSSLVPYEVSEAEPPEPGED